MSRALEPPEVTSPAHTVTWDFRSPTWNRTYSRGLSILGCGPLLQTPQDSRRRLGPGGGNSVTSRGQTGSPVRWKPAWSVPHGHVVTESTAAVHKIVRSHSRQIGRQGRRRQPSAPVTGASSSLLSHVTNKHKTHPFIFFIFVNTTGS